MHFAKYPWSMWKFLESEMLVILGLTEDANRTDREIADAYGLKNGTVSSIRRRLLDAGAIHYAYVPAFNRLGCELMGFHYGTTDPAVRSDTKVSHYMEFCNRTPQVFSALIGGGYVVLYTVLKNATEYGSWIQHHTKFFTGAKRGSKAKLVNTAFPHELSRGTYVPQFAPLVHRYFELDVPKPKSRVPARASVDRVELSETEKDTIIAMVENPSASDREIASRVKLSRQAITRIRSKFTEERLLTKICIPRLYRWGFEIYAVAHPQFSMEYPWNRRLKSQPRDVTDLSFFTVSKADEAVANYMIAKFTEYSEQLESILAWYHRVRALEGKPEVILFSLERSTELRTFDFLPALRNLFGRIPRPSDSTNGGNL